MDSEKSTLAPSDFKDEKLKSSSASVNSVSTTDTLVDNAHFKPNRSLFIDAKGIRLVRLPVNSSQLEIPIYGPDGTLAYVSTRGRMCSSSAVLSSPKRGDLVSTTYFFGPGRNPVIQQLGESPDSKTPGPVNVTGKWISRSTTFVMPDGKTFEWSYVRSKQADGKKRTLLVLHQLDGSGTSAESGRRIAQLVRSSETRPQGSSKHCAGNGGELVLDENSVEWLEEPMIVATCILMLKKEIDRRRLLQMAVLAGGAGGGS